MHAEVNSYDNKIIAGFDKIQSIMLIEYNE